MRRAAALAALAAALVAAPVTHAAFPGVNGRIAFERPGGGLWDVAADGSGERQLSPVASAPETSCDAHPSYSPGGATLAFDSCLAGGQIVLAHADGSQRRILAGTPPDAQQPVFAPDGLRVAFQAGRYRTGVYVENAAGGGLATIASGGYGPGWSQLGPVAFAMPQRDAQWCNSTVLEDLWGVKAPGARARRITRNYASYDPDFSPDGSRVAFTRDESASARDLIRVRGVNDCRRMARPARRYGEEVYVARADGRGMRRITTSGGRAPVWSPDGTQIAFERRPFIYVMNADGSHVRRLVRGRDPAWQPLPAPNPG